jgi:hypothetical protein
MGLAFPYAVLSFSGYVGVDGDPIRATDVNRLHQEITAIEAALGRGIKGTAATLAARLSVNFNADGTWKKEIICEDAAGGVGARRLIGRCNRTTLALSNVTTFHCGTPYGRFDSTPIYLLCVTGAATAYQQGRISQPTPAGFYPIGSQVTTNSDGVGNQFMTAVAISDLIAFDDDALYGYPPAVFGEAGNIRGLKFEII